MDLKQIRNLISYANLKDNKQKVSEQISAFVQYSLKALKEWLKIKGNIYIYFHLGSIKNVT